MRGTVKVLRTARRLCAGHRVSGFSLLTEAARGFVLKRVNRRQAQAVKFVKSGNC